MPRAETLIKKWQPLWKDFYVKSVLSDCLIRVY